MFDIRCRVRHVQLHECAPTRNGANARDHEQPHPSPRLRSPVLRCKIDNARFWRFSIIDADTRAIIDLCILFATFNFFAAVKRKPNPQTLPVLPSHPAHPEIMATALVSPMQVHRRAGHRNGNHFILPLNLAL